VKRVKRGKRARRADLRRNCVYRKLEKREGGK